MHGFIRGYRRHRQSARRHFLRSGERAAALRALTGARLYLTGQASSIRAAAECCGSNVLYVRAAVTLCRAENSALRDRVLRGCIPLMEAARQVEHIAGLVRAYRAASTADCVGFVKAVGGPTVLFDTVLVPAINAAEVAAMAEAAE
jgi:hypothetical protein